jgi:hypothetical protein
MYFGINTTQSTFQHPRLDYYQLTPKHAIYAITAGFGMI